MGKRERVAAAWAMGDLPRMIALRQHLPDDEERRDPRQGPELKVPGLLGSLAWLAVLGLLAVALLQRIF